MRKTAFTALAASLLALSAPAAAQTFPRTIPTPDGAVIIADESSARAYEFGYAATRRAGDVLYVSGVIVGRAPGEGSDVEAFKAQLRRGFKRLDALLRANGLTFANVAMINSFHVWDGPNFAGDRMAQIRAVIDVKNELLADPHPAWTAVGTTGLLDERGILEIQLIAHYPPAQTPAAPTIKR